VNRLKRLYELSMTLSGDPMDIFVHVARMIGELLEVQVVCLSEIRGRELHFLSVYVKGDILVNAGHCPLDITPCATVEASRDLRVYDNVAELFPQATFLREHNAYSYCGFPSLDNDGKVVAVTCLLDDRPHEFTLEDREMLLIAGQRIGLEIARRKLEARLRQQQAQLIHAQRLTTAGELAAAIVHELNQPLGAILSYAGAASLEFAELMATHPKLRETLDEIQRMTQRASGIVCGIRDLVRRQDADAKPEWVDIRALIEEILVFTRGELTRRGIRLTMAIPSTLPRVRGSRIRLQQLFLNLILNAMDATSLVEERRRILTLRAATRRDRTVRIFVHDGGPGIAPAIAERLFEPFVTDKPHGIGLGLSLCRAIAETHGGKIAARSAVGQGACFEVTLPLGAGESSDAR
jgi:C4-dicarboxylate-specific signal transduction histidine kinase